MLPKSTTSVSQFKRIYESFNKQSVDDIKDAINKLVNSLSCHRYPDVAQHLVEISNMNISVISLGQMQHSVK